MNLPSLLALDSVNHTIPFESTVTASGADAIVGTSYSSTLFSGTGAVSAETQLSWRVMIAIIVQAKNRVTVMISDSPHHWGLLWKIRGLLSSVGRNFRNSIDYS